MAEQESNFIPHGASITFEQDGESWQEMPTIQQTIFENSFVGIVGNTLMLNGESIGVVSEVQMETPKDITPTEPTLAELHPEFPVVEVYDPYANGDLGAWYTMQQQLVELKDQEITLRRKLVKHFFPDITEGTTTRRLPDGAQIKGEGKVTRKVVEDVFLALRDEFANDHHLPLDQLVKWKPELSVSAYRGLTDEQREVFDQVLDISEGAPTLKIVPAKKARDPL